MIFLLLVPLQKLQLSNADRARVTLISGLVAVGYVTLVYLIFYPSIRLLMWIMSEGFKGATS